MATTIKDIAQLAGVSTATVSKVLNRKDAFIGEETRKRIRALARELNYTPNSIARSLVTRRSRPGHHRPRYSQPLFHRTGAGLR